MTNREILNADGMSLVTYVGGMSQVGVGVLGTWVGTVTFYGSADGVTYWLLSMTPYASGTAVSSTTANGNWFTDVKNMNFVKVVFTRTSGSVQLAVAASQDASWQNAFLTSAQVNNNSSATSGTNTLTQASQVNRAWNLSSLAVSIAGPAWAGGTMRLRVYDGTVAGTVLFSQFIPEVSGSVGREYPIDLPEGGIVGTPGNAMTIVLFGPGATQASEINAKFG